MGANLDFTNADTLIESYDEFLVSAQDNAVKEALSDIRNALRTKQLDGLSYCVCLSLESELEEQCLEK